jgi:N utilization substance protein B
LHKSSLKHLATPEERKPNEKFIKIKFSNSFRKQFIKFALENRKINNWSLNDDYILLLLNDVKASDLYA